MTTPSYSFKDGRVWLQRTEFSPFELLLPYGLTSITDPAGSLTAVREPSRSQRRQTDIVDILRSEPELPGFTIETRLRKTLNYMFGLKNCRVNFQAHLGACDRPDNYYSSELAVDWQEALRGDMSIDRLALIEGDDAPVAIQTPWSAELGPFLIDFKAEFLSARTISETEAITDMALLSGECEDCAVAAENVYAVTEVLAGSPLNVANVWWSEDKGETWSETSERPLAAGSSISAVVAQGSKFDHRIIVFNGTTDGANPASGAYADVTTPGITSWVDFSIGSVNGQYVIYAFWLDYSRLFVVTDDGYVYKSADGGATWNAKLTTAAVQLNDIYALPDGTIWVVGATNYVAVSEDGGEGWTVVTGPTGGSGDNNTTVAIKPNGSVIIGNDAGEIYGSNNVGKTWTALAAQGVAATSIQRLRPSPDNGQVIWAAVNLADASGRVLRSTDGGATFRLWSLQIPTNSGLNALVPADLNIAFVGGEPHGGQAFVTRTKSNVVGLV